MLTANETIATLNALPVTSRNRDRGGNAGAGMLYNIKYVIQLITFTKIHVNIKCPKKGKNTLSDYCNNSITMATVNPHSISV